MDRRLALELLPGIAFLVGHWVGGLFWGAGLSVVATALAVGLRWRWDGAIPWLAVATFVLIAVLTVTGVLLKDDSFVQLRPTVGSLAFAAILAVGAFARPSLLWRTLHYKLQLTPHGWHLLHAAWVGLALLAAGANEVARQVLSTDHWVIFNLAADPALFGLIWIATRGLAEFYWDEDQDADDAP